MTGRGERGGAGLNDGKTIARFPIIARSIRHRCPHPDTPFRWGHLVGFSAFFGDGEKYRARYCVRRELRLVNRPILFNRLYRVNNRAHLPSALFARLSLSSLFFPFTRCPIHSG